MNFWEALCTWEALRGNPTINIHMIPLIAENVENSLGLLGQFADPYQKGQVIAQVLASYGVQL